MTENLPSDHMDWNWLSDNIAIALCSCSPFWIREYGSGVFVLRASVCHDETLQVSLKVLQGARGMFSYTSEYTDLAKDTIPYISNREWEHSPEDGYAERWACNVLRSMKKQND
jgi:hypothetical protein